LLRELLPELYLGWDNLLLFAALNTILQVPTWYFLRKQATSLLSEIINMHITWFGCLFLCELVERSNRKANEQATHLHRVGFYIMSQLIIHFGTVSWAWFTSEVRYSHLPHLSKRQKNPPLFKTIAYLIMGSILDGLTIYVMWRISPDKYDIHVNTGPFTYLSQVISIGALVITDFNFLFWHGLLLHGPLWFLHKHHHSNYRPTCISGRVFDPLDYIIEVDFTFIALLVPFVLILKPLGLWNSYVLSCVGVFGMYFSTIHHSGKADVPAPFPGMLPWSELVSSLAVSEDANALALHEGHHNWISCNYGLFGFADRLCGTFKHAKGWENHRDKNKKA